MDGLFDRRPGSARPITRRGCRAEEKVAVGSAISDPINRNVFAGSMEVRPPTISKIFDRKLFGYVMKHTVEPRVVYRYQSGIENFGQILRFDQRDILADTNAVEYGVVNRMFAKKTKVDRGMFSTSAIRAPFPAERTGGQDDRGDGSRYLR